MFEKNSVSNGSSANITKIAFTKFILANPPQRIEHKTSGTSSCESQQQQSVASGKNYIDQQNQNISPQNEGFGGEKQLEKCLTSVYSNQNKNWKSMEEKFVDQDDIGKRQNKEGESTAPIVKGSWTKDEDQLLISLVMENGAKNWSSIAKKLKGRMGKQCRQRWHNHLNPDIKKQKWTQEEDRKIIEYHQKFGNKWALISRYLPGRTDNAIKNHWNSTISRKLAQENFLKKLDIQPDDVELTPRKSKIENDWNTANTNPYSQTPDRSGQKYSTFLGSLSVNLFSKKKMESQISRQETEKSKGCKVGFVLPLFHEIQTNSGYLLGEIYKILEVQSLMK